MKKILIIEDDVQTRDIFLECLEAEGFEAIGAENGFVDFQQAQQQLPYCIASAVFSLSLFVLTLIGRDWEDIGQLFFIATIVGMLTLIGTLAIYPPNKRPITSTQSNSGATEIALVQHLNQVGAKMYGAFWCSHCHKQKEMFGQAAWSQINYIECDPNGKNPRPDFCQSANIQGFPTWEIKGRFYQGEQSLEKLAELSGFQEPRNFQRSN